METTINGKRVVLRDVLLAKDAWPIMDIARHSAKGDILRYEDEVESMRRVIESWDMPGDPADAASYDGLDLFREFGPLSNAVAQHLGSMLGQSKN